MEKIFLVEPTNDYEQQAKEFIQEFIDNNSEIHGVGGLENYLTRYPEWVARVEDYSKGINLEDGHVSANTFFAIRSSDNKIVGMIDIRHQLTDYLLKFGGHIGDCVRPSERRKGYATEILYLGLEKCNELGIDRVLVTCDKTNIGSAKQIQNNLGVLENEILDGDNLMQRYWIDVEDVLAKRKQVNKGL